MQVIRDIETLRSQIKEWRNDGLRIAFVPTMGNLHQGHLSLVDIAARHADRVVASIYVNPLQFAPGEDYESYPRTLDADLQKLEHSAVDMVFTPDNVMMYGDGDSGDTGQSTYCEVPSLAGILEGEYRPGFFRGVATVVLKLFNLVQPDVAVFGEKDFQQLLVIRRMVSDLFLPIEIVAGDIKREEGGLAMSSRNNYLELSTREKSQLLFEQLSWFRSEVEKGGDIRQAESACVEALASSGFSVDYFTLRESRELDVIDQSDVVTGRELVVLVAASIEGTRLIDNIRFVV